MDISCEAIEIRGSRVSALDSSRSLGMTLKRGCRLGGTSQSTSGERWRGGFSGDILRWLGGKERLDVRNRDGGAC